VTIFAETQPVVIYEPKGEYLDGGNLEGWLRANLTLARDIPKLNKIIKEFV